MTTVVDANGFVISIKFDHEETAAPVNTESEE